MPVRVDIDPALIGWAMQRSKQTPESLRAKLPRIEAWLAGESAPTLKQLETFASATYTPVGSLLLPMPPATPLPVTDFRTMPGARRDPSPDLLDTIQLCEERQEWYRRYARLNGGDVLDFVGSADVGDDPVELAESIRTRLQFAVDQRRGLSSIGSAFSRLSASAEDLGILVMVSGIVGSNTHRRLDPREFRGFALVDVIAPTVFVNGADAKAAQIFTLVHELVHVWLGQAGVSNPQLDQRGDADKIEAFCNRVAAEVLVPGNHLAGEFRGAATLDGELERLAKVYRVSSVVVLRKLHDAGLVDWRQYRVAYAAQVARWAEPTTSGGGDFYNTLPVRTSKRFAQAIVGDTLEGGTLHRDAFRMLGVRKHETFRDLGQKLGYA